MEKIFKIVEKSLKSSKMFKTVESIEKNWKLVRNGKS